MCPPTGDDKGRPYVTVIAAKAGINILIGADLHRRIRLSGGECELRHNQRPASFFSGHRRVYNRKGL